MGVRVGMRAATLILRTFALNQSHLVTRQDGTLRRTETDIILLLLSQHLQFLEGSPYSDNNIGQPNFPLGFFHCLTHLGICNIPGTFSAGK